jgi:hypothetical protein
MNYEKKKGSKEAKYSSGAFTSAPSGNFFSCFLQKVWDSGKCGYKSRTAEF